MRRPFAFALLLLMLQTTNMQAATVEEITGLVGDGHWREARQEIADELARTDLNFQTREDLFFQRDRMKRMRLDFGKTREQVFQEVRAIAPTITGEQFANWEKSGAIEFLDIDGTRRYFDRAAANLFRINPEAKA
ncbi:MAG: hypothetical protein ACREFE_18610, partial [Limisphaerales bacterium]